VSVKEGFATNVFDNDNVLKKNEYYVLSNIATIIVCCVTHCIVLNVIEHCVRVIIEIEKLLFSEFFEPQRHEDTKEHQVSSAKLCVLLFSAIK